MRGFIDLVLAILVGYTVATLYVLALVAATGSSGGDNGSGVIMLLVIGLVWALLARQE